MMQTSTKCDEFLAYLDYLDCSSHFNWDNMCPINLFYVVNFDYVLDGWEIALLLDGFLFLIFMCFDFLLASHHDLHYK
jgi:hypothetical protein